MSYSSEFGRVIVQLNTYPRWREICPVTCLNVEGNGTGIQSLLLIREQMTRRQMASCSAVTRRPLTKSTRIITAVDKKQMQAHEVW